MKMIIIKKNMKIKNIWRINSKKHILKNMIIEIIIKIIECNIITNLTPIGVIY